MEPADHPRPKSLPAGTSKRGSNLASLGLVIGLLILIVVIRLANFQSPRVELVLWIAVIGVVLAFAMLSVGVIRKLRGTEREAKTVFEDREREFHQMADNIQEIFWVIDAQTKTATYVNPAYEAITGRSCRSLLESPSSYEEVIHPDDRDSVLAKLDQAANSGSFDERFRIVKPDGEIRWIWVRGFPRRDVNGKITRLGGTALDITALKKAEDQVAANLAKANSAREEAEALRKATLALTQDLHMDCVLDALLHSLAELVPYTCARVLVPEAGPHWLALREKSSPEPAKKSQRSTLAFVADESPFYEIRPQGVRKLPECLRRPPPPPRSVWRELRRTRLKSLRRNPQERRQMRGTPRPHKKVSNILSTEALVAGLPVTQRHLDFDLFDI